MVQGLRADVPPVGHQVERTLLLQSSHLDVDTAGALTARGHSRCPPSLVRASNVYAVFRDVFTPILERTSVAVVPVGHGLLLGRVVTSTPNLEASTVAVARVRPVPAPGQLVSVTSIRNSGGCLDTIQRIRRAQEPISQTSELVSRMREISKLSIVPRTDEFDGAESDMTPPGVVTHGLRSASSPECDTQGCSGVDRTSRARAQSLDPQSRSAPPSRTLTTDRRLVAGAAECRLAGRRTRRAARRTRRAPRASTRSLGTSATCNTPASDSITTTCRRLDTTRVDSDDA
ncbi:hypothetical protein EXIGLDRAFT_771203 [Exidia glandulosa HHB12029]|uniref:Uncharacterized protein n=1 Tax=Exidia glandulosa HHB12029 TaxID=1314781 RepID=A0A165G546_EXIGL|nr:hypothetical protein EXIGLDRAFT_771203 [Exidia glandulosa HHB12029]